MPQDDAVRLLLHDVDMTCGLDMGMQGGPLMRRQLMRSLDLPPWLDMEGDFGHGSQLSVPINRRGLKVSMKNREHNACGSWDLQLSAFCGVSLPDDPAPTRLPHFNCHADSRRQVPGAAEPGWRRKLT